jgi:hypothetical protein
LSSPHSLVDCVRRRQQTTASPRRSTYRAAFSGSRAGRDTDFDRKTSCGGAFATRRHSTRGEGSIPRHRIYRTSRDEELQQRAYKRGRPQRLLRFLGTAHAWLTWRRCLNDFAPRLFWVPNGEIYSSKWQKHKRQASSFVAVIIQAARSSDDGRFAYGIERPMRAVHHSVEETEASYSLRESG